MPVPKEKLSKGRQGSRRANHDKVAAPNISYCPQCGDPIRSHTVCSGCGTYRGRQVLAVEETKAKSSSEKA